MLALQSLLGALAVPRPAINLGALTLNVAPTPAQALSIARLLEDIGITAYAGALAALSDSNLTFASQILGVESFHSGALRLGIILQNDAAAGTDIDIAASDGLDVAPFDAGSAAVAANGPVTASGGFFSTAAATAVSNATTSVTTPAGATVITPAGYAYTRTAAQVLNLAYSGGTSSGGFFPNGVNGLINSVNSVF